MSDNDSRITGIIGMFLALSLATTFAACKSVPEQQVHKDAADQTLGRSGAPIRFFDLNLYLTISDSATDAATPADGISSLNSGGRLTFVLSDSGMVRVAFRDGAGRSLRVYPDSVYPVPGSHPITISASDTLSDSLTSGIYTCRVLAGDSTIERQFEIPDQPSKR